MQTKFINYPTNFSSVQATATHTKTLVVAMGDEGGCPRFQQPQDELLTKRLVCIVTQSGGRKGILQFFTGFNDVVFVGNQKPAQCFDLTR